MSAMDVAVTMLQVAGALLVGSGIRALGTPSSSQPVSSIGASSPQRPSPRCPASILLGGVLLFATGLGTTALRDLLTMVPGPVWLGVIGATVGLAISLPVSLCLISRRWIGRPGTPVGAPDPADAAALNGLSSPSARENRSDAPGAPS